MERVNTDCPRILSIEDGTMPKEHRTSRTLWFGHTGVSCLAVCLIACLSEKAWSSWYNSGDRSRDIARRGVLSPVASIAK